MHIKHSKEVHKKKYHMNKNDRETFVCDVDVEHCKSNAPYIPGK